MFLKVRGYGTKGQIIFIFRFNRLFNFVYLGKKTKRFNLEFNFVYFGKKTKRFNLEFKTRPEDTSFKDYNV